MESHLGAIAPPEDARAKNVGGLFFERPLKGPRTADQGYGMAMIARCALCAVSAPRRIFVVFATLMLAIAGFADRAHAESYVTGPKVHAAWTPASGTRLCMTNWDNGVVILNICDGSERQNWSHEKIPNQPWFQIKNRQTGECLGMWYWGAVLSTNTARCDNWGQTGNLNWNSSGDALVNSASGLCLYGRGVTLIGGAPCNGSTEQMWKNKGNWPNYTILVHGYAGPKIRDKAKAGAGNPRDYWYWRGNFSNNQSSYDIVADLRNAAAYEGVINYDVVAANWDGRSKIEPSSSQLVAALLKYCTGANTCDLVGHSTGDAIIGYTLDKYQQDYTFNIRTVFVAGGAGGGTQTSNLGQWFNYNDPVVAQLVPTVMMNLYNHNMRGKYANVPNIRFVGSGKDNDVANGIPYSVSAPLIRGDNDGLVPFSSQAGVSQYVGNTAIQGYDAYCLQYRNTLFSYSCGQINWGSGPAYQWGFNQSSAINLFAGYKVQFLDWGGYFNHTDEVGYVAKWISQYKRSSDFPVSIVSQGLANAGRRVCVDVNNGARAAYTYNCNGTDAQLFINDGSGRLKWAKDPSRCLDIQDGKNEKLATLQIYSCHTGIAGGGHPPQLFDLSFSPPLLKFPAGPSKGGQKCLGSDGALSTPGTRINLWDCIWTNNQKWSLEKF